MSASEHLNRYQLRYQPLPKNYEPEMRHSVHAIDKETGKPIGHLQWSGEEWGGRIWDVGVHEEHQRRGLGTAMYQHAKEIAKNSGGRITPPEHSDARTEAGDAWAQKVGGNLPENKYQ